MNYEVQRIQHALLDDALLKGIQRNEEQCKVWRAYKKGHEKVAETLHTFQKDLYVNCMVPIGTRALMKGRLIHTNEVLAFLGDGYFAKYSVTGAAELCQRRIQKADEMLKNLNTERDLYETRLMALDSNIFEDCAGSEIVEHWNEEQIEDWKKKHREREREYHKKLNKLRQEEKKKIETEEDLFNRLDQLEIEEELADELNRLEEEGYDLYGEELGEGKCYYESESSSDNEQDSLRETDGHTPDSEKKQEGENVKSSKMTKSVSFAEIEDSTDKEKNENLKEAQETNTEEVEGSEEDILRIKFSHSSHNPVIKSEGNSIESPADIYKIFSKPKSILKRSPNDVASVQITPPDYSTEEEDEEESNKPSAYEAVVKDIKERDTIAPTSSSSKTEKDTRPISKFKRDRQLK